MATALISALTTAGAGRYRDDGRNHASGTGAGGRRVQKKLPAPIATAYVRLIAPKENARDLLKLSPTVRRELEIIFASNMDQVIAAAIRLDETQVGGLLEGIEPAAAAVKQIRLLPCHRTPTNAGAMNWEPRPDLAAPKSLSPLALARSKIDGLKLDPLVPFQTFDSRWPTR